MSGDTRRRVLLAGQVLSFDDDPTLAQEAVVHIENGVVAVEDGRIIWVGDGADLPPSFRVGAELHDYGDHLILPGFLDCHVHYPQLGVMASYGTQLLEWLETYTFPEEARYDDPVYARVQARLFLDLLVANGVTTAAVYCTVHPESVDAFFEEALTRGLRVIAGKVLMDRNAPAALRDTARSGYEHSRSLITRWHGRGRGLYAVTPRFAPTSTPEQLGLCGDLLAEFPDVYLQTHLAENTEETAWVAELFPEAVSYLDVYDRAGLLGPRTLFGHAIFLDNRDLDRIATSGSRLVHCPTSNLFVGSGLFNMRQALDSGARVALASDVGGGSSLSPFATMKAAYEIAQLSGWSLPPELAFWLVTAGAARALSLDDSIGRVAVGYEADLVIVDPRSTPVIRQRVDRAESLTDVLFAQIVLADDRAICATYADGKRIFRQGE